MSTGLIIALVVIAIVLIAVFVLVGRKKKSERNQVKAGELRQEAEQRSLTADKERAIADEQAARARKEAAEAEERAQFAEREREVADQQHAKARDLDPDGHRREGRGDLLPDGGNAQQEGLHDSTERRPG